MFKFTKCIDGRLINTSSKQSKNIEAYHNPAQAYHNAAAGYLLMTALDHLHEKAKVLPCVLSWEPYKSSYSGEAGQDVPTRSREGGSAL